MIRTLVVISFLLNLCQLYGQERLYSRVAELPAPDRKAFDAVQNPAHAQKLKAGMTIPTHLSEKDLEWEYTSGKFSASHAITTPGAKGMILYFEQLELGEDGVMIIENTKGRKLLGPFTREDIQSRFALPALRGDTLVMHFMAESKTAVKFRIAKIGYLFVAPFFERPSATINGLGSSGTCEVNVACSEGDNWRRQQRSIVRVQVLAQSIVYYCSGVLVNNTAQDLKPYILSAMHCAQKVNGDLIDSNEFQEWVFLFNYESDDCSDPDTDTMINKQFITGAVVRANSDDNGGDHGSDFLLVELSKKVPASFNPYYSGWNRKSEVTQTGVCIHHPAGDIKKISTYISKPVSYTPGSGTGEDTHWLLTWSPTVNGYGVTEEGSSGAPIFNDQGLIVGTLTGGDASCDAKGSPDFFGKFSYHWTLNGTADGLRLQPWLDPLATGAEKLNGAEFPSLNASPVHTQAFHIYPNPVKEKLYITSNAVADYNVSDGQGRICAGGTLQEGETSIDLSFLQPGIYFVSIAAEYTSVYKIVKW